MDYSQKVINHFQNPRNVGVIEDANGIGAVGDENCGDYLVVYIKVNEDEIIEDIKYKVRGCAAAVATSSAVTLLVKNLHVYDALNVNELDIVDYLDGLPDEKYHCSVLGAEGVRRAIYDYLGSNI